MKKAHFFCVLLLAIFTSACGTLASEENTGVVMARRAQVRSSTAVVAADLKEVVRGEELDILDSTVAENGEHWLRVRTRDVDGTEGWIESRNVMPREMLERSRQLAKEDENIPAQATGQLRASTNIRFTPDRSDNQNIMMKLESGARFEIIGWKRVPKPKTSEVTESDDAPKAGSVQQPEGGIAREDRDSEEVEEEADELWYKVRLAQATSPAPAGWIYGKQVELTVPSDIIFYRTGREFVAWQRLDDDSAGHAERANLKDKDAAKEVQPGSWVILEKSSSPEAKKEASDFDRIFVLGYDKDRQEHYTAYRSPDLQGYLPLRLEGRSDNKTFTVRLMQDEQLKESRFRAYIDDRGLLRVEPLDELPKGKKK